MIQRAMVGFGVSFDLLVLAAEMVSRLEVMLLKALIEMNSACL